MNGKYILEGKTPTPIDDLLAWGEWMESADRQVALDEIDGITVSTVFLGLEHGDRNLFETMVFGGPIDGEGARYQTWEQAEQGHAEMIAKVKAALQEEANSSPALPYRKHPRRLSVPAI